MIPKHSYSYRRNYGYKKIDDALEWFYRNALDLDAKNQALLTKGRKDETSVAEISVTIRYTPQFANTLGVFYPDGLLMVAAWTIDVIIFIKIFHD